MIIGSIGKILGIKGSITLGTVSSFTKSVSVHVHGSALE